MKLLQLAKKLDFQTGTEYFDYLINSHFNGQLNQCRNLFKAMTKEDKKAFLSYVLNSGMLSNDIHEIHSFYFNLL